MFLSRKTVQFFLLILPVPILILWYFIKVFQFQSLSADFSDAILSLHLSRGWLEGRPFLYDNFYGFHTRIHNYYFIPLTGVFTYHTGIYGLFIIYLGLIATLLIKLGLWFRKAVNVNFASNWLAVCGFIIGPFTYHIYLDLYGWHPEQYFLPLMGLLAFFLARRKWVWVFVFTLLVASVKETSGVLLCGLLLFASTLDSVSKLPGKKWFEALFSKRNVAIMLGCFAFFCFGMLWIAHQQVDETSRLSHAFDNISKINTDRQVLYYLVQTLVFSFMTFAAGIVFFLPWRKILPGFSLLISLLAAYFLVLVVVFTVEGFYYFPNLELGLAYPSRIGGLWSFMMSCYIFMSVRLSQQVAIPGRNISISSLGSIILQLMLSPLLISQSPSKSLNFDQLQNAVLSFVKHDKLGLTPYRYSHVEELFNLAKQLPRGAEVVAPVGFLPVFENVYPTEWKHLDLLTRRPALYIVDKETLERNSEVRLPGADYKLLPSKYFIIYKDTTWSTQRLK